ncbi:MAG TPA: hypothetical protein VK582_12110 [Pyrinomonadaceae bacterium]|nr:hypothetical protein [Pyrinomonadaceae bacterium]
MLLIKERILKQFFRFLACRSQEKRRGPINSKRLAQLAYEKGMYIVTSIQSYRAAQEVVRLGHGFSDLRVG